MRERIIKAGVLSAVFVLAIIMFSHFTNKGSADTTIDMDSATFPTVSFVVEGYEVNVLPGYKNEMNIPMMRDAVTLLDSNECIRMNIQPYGQTIEAVTYELYSLDGTEKLYEQTKTQVEEVLVLEAADILEAEREAVLKLTIQTESEDAIYYYTRVKNSGQYYTKECMEFVENLHTNILNKTNTNDIKSVIESNAEGDNTTYGHVTINSDLEHVTWGDLEPQLQGDVKWSLEETNEVYTAIQLKYQVSCKGDNNEWETHNVREYFRVRYVDGEIYLLGYDRTMNQIFEASKQILSSKGVNLGISSEEIVYMTNDAGTISAFVKERELWCYDKEEDTLALVFSFVDTAREDLRNLYDQHAIHILSMDDVGNMTFGVYGYMNRGAHEGEVGAAIYYYDLSQNTVEEKVFIPTNQCFKIVEDELGQLAYYNEEQKLAYVLVDGILYKIHLQSSTKEVLVEGLSEGQYVTAKDGHLLAYQKGDNLMDTTEVVVLDLKSGKEQVITAEEGANIRPLGFMGDDFVYGFSTEADAGETIAGSEIIPMYKLEICDFDGNVLKTYEVDGVYMESVSIEANMITLNRVMKKNGTYKNIDNDYITNHTETRNGSISLQIYITDLKETQYRLEYESVIEDKKAKVLHPKQVIIHEPMTLAFESEEMQDSYYVYGMGEMLGSYAKAGEAIRHADKVEGVVTSSKQQLVWEKANKHAWYRNFEISRFNKKDGESSLEACLRQILNYEGVDFGDSLEAEDANAAVSVLNGHKELTGINLTGCSAKELRYFVGKGLPVIALTDRSSGVLLIGYDANTVTYADPSSGNIKSCTMEQMETMTEGSGNTYIGYVKSE